MNWRTLVAIFAFTTASSQGAEVGSGSVIARNSGLTQGADESHNTGAIESLKLFNPNATGGGDSEDNVLSNRHTVVPETTSIVLGMLGLLLILRRRK